MADYVHVQDPFTLGDRVRCNICQREMYRDESRATDAMICSEYCRGRHDERTGVPLR